MATIAPPIAGPTLRVRLKPTLFSATAAGRSARGTMSPTDACQDGLLSAVPQPIRKVKARRDQGDSTPSQAARARDAETQSMKPWAISMTRRRLKLSAMAPEASEKTMIGNVVEACTSATMLAEVVIEVIIQAAPTACTSPPKFDARLASQIARNVGFLSGASAEARGFAAVSMALGNSSAPDHAHRLLAGNQRSS